MFVQPPQRPYFYLPELAGIWGLSIYDVYRLIETDALRVSFARADTMVWLAEIGPLEEFCPDATAESVKSEGTIPYPSDYEPFADDHWASGTECLRDDGPWQLHVADARKLIVDGHLAIQFVDEDVEDKGHPVMSYDCMFFEHPITLTPSHLIVTAAQRAAFEETAGVRSSLRDAVSGRMSRMLDTGLSRLARRLSK